MGNYCLISISVWDDEKILKLDDGDSGTRVQGVCT